ncbi:MAG: DUF3325 family protein [Thiobacillus sp.]|nr:DUF3325 family protein [Thiobacillus sp.]
MVDSTGLILAGAALAAVAGFAWLALAMAVHWEQVQGSAAPKAGVRRALRTLGFASLAASAALCFLADRPSMALLVWIMLMAGGAVAVALALAWKPAMLRLLWPKARS